VDEAKEAVNKWMARWIQVVSMLPVLALWSIANQLMNSELIFYTMLWAMAFI
jgi:hypothetical protein